MLDNLPISILARDMDGRRTTHIWPNQSALISALAPDDQKHIDPEEDEILLVTLGSYVLYSQLASQDPLTVEDIVGFFA